MVGYYAMRLVLENYGLLVYMYHAHRSYQISIFCKKIMRIIFKFLQYFLEESDYLNGELPDKISF